MNENGDDYISWYLLRVVVSIFVDPKFVNKFFGYKVKVLTDLGELSWVQSFLTGIIHNNSHKYQHTAPNKVPIKHPFLPPIYFIFYMNLTSLNSTFAAFIERSYYLPITGSRNFLACGKSDKKGR